MFFPQHWRHSVTHFRDLGRVTASAMAHLFSYGKRMVEAALQHAPSNLGHSGKPPTEEESDPHMKTAKWLETCETVSTLSQTSSATVVPPSVKSIKSQTTQFPALHHKANGTCTEWSSDGEEFSDDPSDEDYQPTKTVNTDSDGESTTERAQEDTASTEQCAKTVNTDSDGESTTERAQEDTANTEQCVGHARCRKGKAGYFLDKKQYCFFCLKGQLNLSRHISQIHKNEKPVAQMLAYKELGNNEKYQKELTQLRCAGNFKHNMGVLKEGRVDLIVVKRPSKKRSIHAFLPCPYCFGFYFKAELWRHAKKCILKPEDPSQSSDILRESKLLLETACLKGTETGLSPNMISLIAAMRDDELTRTLTKDELLLQFGENLLKYGPSKKNDIAQRMRQLTRLLITCRGMKKMPLTFRDLLCGQHFDTCLDATSSLCGLTITADGRREFKIPSLALRLGHLLKKMSVIKKGRCLRQDDLTALKEAETFENLLRDEWTDAVSSNALNSLKRRKDQTVETLPETDDLLKLKDHQSEVIKEAASELRTSPTYSSWRTLAQTVMARLIIFNKRRAGEVSRLTLDTYKNRPEWKTAGHSEILESLQPLEKKLLDKTDLVMVPGKRNRKVPILIPTNLSDPMELLMNSRQQVCIPASNPFFFSSKSTRGYLDGWQSINASTSNAGLENPDLITSTKCRKYNATITQLFDLPPGDVEWLANHMGHSVNIHKEYYRLHESTIEITKVGKLLAAVDSGKGLTIGSHSKPDSESDENVAQTSTTCTSQPADDDNAATSAKPVGRPNAKQKGKKLPDHAKEGGDEHSMGFIDHHVPEDSEDSFKPAYKKRTKRKQIRKVLSSSSSEPEHISDSEAKIARRSKVKKSNSRKTWTSAEIDSLNEVFRPLLEKGLYPSAVQIQSAKTRFPEIASRSTPQIKAKLQHLMKSIKG